MNKLLLLLSVFIVACGSPSKKEDLSQMKQEVMTIHDEVMPKMGELRKVRKELLLRADSLMKTDVERATLFTTVAEEIGDANEGMMQWMRAYEPDMEGSDEEIKAYLMQQKEAIVRVKENMNKSLAKGKSLLEN